MKKICLVALLGIAHFTSGQVGIGTTTPNAQLDIPASNPAIPVAKDGILIPRISSFPAISPTALQNGMLVFLTALSGSNLPGFYYWNNATTTWIGLSSNGKSWDTIGNSTSVSGVNFLGTTNLQDLDFRTNNVIKMRLSTKGQLEFLNVGGSLFIGEGAGENEVFNANRNIFIGYHSGFLNTTGFKNNAQGYATLQNNSTGFDNTAIGYEALRENTIGKDNVAIGTNAMSENITGVYNTAIGSGAGTYATGASRNTSIGYNAQHLTNAPNNTAIGANAMQANTIGYGNTAIGSGTLLNNVDGYYNTISGFNAMHDNVSGHDNTVMGGSAMYYNTTGHSNTASGSSALLGNLTGNNNTALGYNALITNSIGNNNTGIGRTALFRNQTGINNTATGINALYINSIGNANTALGKNALYYNDTGNNNTALGADAGPALPAFDNTTSIGSGSLVNVSNKVRLGNSAVTLIEGQVSWSNPSDARFKSDVSQNIPGLDFILKLKPVTYHFNTRKFDEHLMSKLPDSIRNAALSKTDYTASERVLHSGFLAQDIEKAANSIGYDFDGLHVPDASNPTDNYSVSYSQFIMPLVKSVQEQQAEIEKLKAENAALKKESLKQSSLIEAFEKRMSALEKK